MELELPPSYTDNINRTSKKTKWLLALMALGVLVVAAIGYGAYWYTSSLKPLSPTAEAQLFEVEQGQSTQQIASNLEDANLIADSIAFQIYSRLNRGESGLQTGVYELSAAESVQDIHRKMVGGESATRSVAIIPGFTIGQIEDRLIGAGYQENDVREALNGSYDVSVTQYLPDSGSLEGFLYPDTYIAGLLQSPSVIIELALQEMELALTPDIIQGFERQDLTVFEGVTLASIVQQEIADPEIQRQVAQVYLKRLSEDIRLDADPTFRYASELAGVEDRLDIDSPYNTRRVKGLPPGPIGSVTADALAAVANPAEGDYLFFVSGDDGTTYFSRTLQEHEANVEKYCEENCRVRFD